MKDHFILNNKEGQIIFWNNGHRNIYHLTLLCLLRSKVHWQQRSWSHIVMQVQLWRRCWVLCEQW